MEIVTSARVTSITHRQREIASDSSSADSDHSAETHQEQEQEQEQRRARFELAFTTEAPLPPTVRNTLGVAAAAEPAKATDSTDGIAGGGAASTTRHGGSGVGGASSGRSLYRIPCDYVLQATGAAREGHGWARTLGHAVAAPVPSLFTLTIRDPR